MANNVTNGGDDSENSVFEIELPKKPLPQIIDLADDEIIINVRAEIPDTPISPNVPWVSQFDFSRFRPYFEESAINERLELPKISNLSSPGLYDTTEFGPYIDELGEERKEEEGVDPFLVFCEGNNDDKSKEDNSDEHKESSDEKMKEKGVIKLKNERGAKNKGKKGKKTDGNRELNKDKDKKKKQKRSDKIRDKKREKRKCKKDKKKDESHERHEGHGERNLSHTEENESRQNNHSRSGYQPPPSSPAMCSMQSILQALKETTQSKLSRSNNQAQQGSSGSCQLSSFPQDSRPHTQTSRHYLISTSPHSESRRTHAPYSSLAYPNLATELQKNEDSKDHPEHWTPEMVRFYDEDWGNENEFDLNKLQAEMDKNPSLWEISDKDVAFWINKDKFKVKCYNCFSYGHLSYECKEQKRTPKCHMCGLPGHIAYKCPQSICLNCATSTTGYVNNCTNCKFSLNKTCERCFLTGHIFSECTDHWRLYHSTVGTIQVNEPLEEILKSEEHRWCCNCGRKGHLQVDCGFCAKNPEFSDSNPFVTSYTKAFTRSSQLSYGYEDPATQERLKIKMEDNIMTNPSQTHHYHNKTSQVKNYMKSLKKEMLKKGFTANSNRRRHFAGGIGERHLNILRSFPSL